MGTNGLDGLDGLGPLTRLRLLTRGWAERMAGGAAPSVDSGWYGAFLQNAGVGAVEYPERCSGLVCGVPLGHGMGWLPG